MVFRSQILYSSVLGIGVSERFCLTSALLTLQANAVDFSRSCGVSDLIDAYKQPYPYLEKPLWEWSMYDTAIWLEGYGKHFKSIGGIFLSRKVDGFVLPHISHADLKNIFGIHRDVDCHFIMKELGKISAQTSRSGWRNR